MDWGRFVPGFHIFFWLTCQTVLARVEPPTNVTLHCHNLHNVLKWNYDQVLPGLRFKIDIMSLNSPPNMSWVDPPAQQADVSFLSDPNNEYYLQVTAVVGDNASEPAPQDGIEFSYYREAVASRKCHVDLPPVNVTAEQDAKVRFHFTHPWLLYCHKLTGSSGQKCRRKKKKRQDDAAQIKEWLPEFHYIVTMEEKRHNFICEEGVCENTLPVDAAPKNHCLTITGHVEKLTVKGTQLYCATPYTKIPEPYNNIYISLCVLAVGLAAGFVVFMVCWKAIRPSSLRLPTPIFVNKITYPTLRPQQERTHIVEVGPTTPTPLLHDENENKEEMIHEFTSTDTPPSYDFRLPINGLTVDEGVCDGMEEGQPNDEEDVYMGGRGLDDDDDIQIFNGYERRPVLDSLGPDDRTEGYRG